MRAAYPVIIGHVCIEPISDDVAEIAIAVTDAWQGHGVGRAMLACAISWAQAHGIARLASPILMTNTAMFGLLRSMGYPITYGGSARARSTPRSTFGAPTRSQPDDRTSTTAPREMSASQEFSEARRPSRSAGPRVRLLVSPRQFRRTSPRGCSGRP